MPHRGDGLVTAGGRTYLVCSLTLLPAGCSPTGGAAPSSATQAGTAAGTTAPPGGTPGSCFSKPIGVAPREGPGWATQYERSQLVPVAPRTNPSLPPPPTQ